MSRILKAITLVTLFALGSFAFVSKPASAETAALETAAAAGPYSAHCASCHGQSGHADTAKGRELDADDLTSGKVQGMSTSRLTSIIKHGKGDMPGFPKLSKAQISSIIKTVKSF